MSTKDRFLRYCVVFHHLPHPPQIQSLPFPALLWVFYALHHPGSLALWLLVSWAYGRHLQRVRRERGRVIIFLPNFFPDLTCICGSCCGPPSLQLQLGTFLHGSALLGLSGAAMAFCCCMSLCASNPFTLPMLLWVVPSWKSLHLNHLSQILFPDRI